MAADPSPPEELTYEEGLEVDTTAEAGQETTSERSEHATHESKSFSNNEGLRTNGTFVHGLSVGVGLGCIATFVIVWFVIFFTPQIPAAMTYQNLLSVFIYPMIYLLVVGLVALTAGIVRQYYSTRLPHDRN